MIDPDAHQSIQCSSFRIRACCHLVLIRHTQRRFVGCLLTVIVAWHIYCIWQQKIIEDAHTTKKSGHQHIWAHLTITQIFQWWMRGLLAIKLLWLAIICRDENDVYIEAPIVEFLARRNSGFAIIIFWLRDAATFFTFMWPVKRRKML